jgi:hypothetical protein
MAIAAVQYDKPGSIINSVGRRFVLRSNPNLAVPADTFGITSLAVGVAFPIPVPVSARPGLALRLSKANNSQLISIRGVGTTGRQTLCFLAEGEVRDVMLLSEATFNAVGAVEVEILSGGSEVGASCVLQWMFAERYLQAEEE